VYHLIFNLGKSMINKELTKLLINNKNRGVTMKKNLTNLLINNKTEVHL